MISCLSYDCFFFTDHTRLGVYVLDGEPSYSHLLKFALSEKKYDNVTVMLCVSMTQPWQIMDSLNSWATILRKHCESLKLSADQRKEWEQKGLWRTYLNISILMTR